MFLVLLLIVRRKKECIFFLQKAKIRQIKVLCKKKNKKQRTNITINGNKYKKGQQTSTLSIPDLAQFFNAGLRTSILATISRQVYY